MQENTNTHYLDAYYNWDKAHMNASNYMELVKTRPLMIRTIDLMKEWQDAEILHPSLALARLNVIESQHAEKLKFFLN